MRQTRIEHDQLWDQLNVNVDDYVEKRAKIQLAKDKKEVNMTHDD